ncbi:PE family protein [Mycobacterium simiae]|uniref:PE family protein n=1 Tax=Mycobacterium simiae TaxID=1784 RepID=A0A5B1BTF3_MYCSI|nr:PE family protein [Mycobacterium simiae]
MSFVTVVPEMLVTAVQDVASIGTSVSAVNAAGVFAVSVGGNGGHAGTGVGPANGGTLAGADGTNGLS